MTIPVPDASNDEVREVTVTEVEILSGVPAGLTRPLALVGDHAYAVTVVPIQTTTRRTTAGDDGAVTEEESSVAMDLVVVRDDGQMFSDAGHARARPLAACG